MTKKGSIKKNIVWSSTLTIAGYIFPLITFPYVTRVLGVDGFGNNQFAESVTHYFCILAMLGVSTVGIREIAKARGNRIEMSKVFNSLMALNLVATFLSVILLLVLSFTIPSFESHSKMLYYGMGRILFNTLLVEWLFKGIEDFKYITVRAILVRCIYVISVFIFVRKPDDYVLYFVLTSLMTVVNALINIAYSKRFVDFSLSNIDIRPYLKPVLILGLYSVLTSMYTSLNPIFLGAIGGDTQVGYYTSATKIHHVILSFYTAFTGVMLPRMSSLLAENKENDFRRMIEKSYSLLFLFSFPLILFAYIFTPEIINILAGQGYEQSIDCLRIVLPLVFVIGYEQIIVIQILMPMRKDRAILINSIIGACVCVVANMVLVKSMMCRGTSWVWFLSEVSVLVSAQFFVSKYTSIRFPFKLLIKNLLYALPILGVLLFVSQVDLNRILILSISAVLLLAYYSVLYVYVLKIPIVVESIKTVKKKVFHV